ncbi:MAG TPA: hypothetical protein VND87_13325 [Stellaceae bacterium]|nr:hypothetical protein [Stellaceae bacterium]
MPGDYPSADFEISDDGAVRRVMHLPTGMTIETNRLRVDPIAVSAMYKLRYDDAVQRPGEVAQAALRHLRVWLMRRYGFAPDPGSTTRGLLMAR